MGFVARRSNIQQVAFAAFTEASGKLPQREELKLAPSPLSTLLSSWIYTETDFAVAHLNPVNVITDPQI